MDSCQVQSVLSSVHHQCYWAFGHYLYRQVLFFIGVPFHSIWPKRPFCCLKLCRYYLLFLVKAILSSYRGKGDLLNHSIPKGQNFMMQFLLAYRVASVEWTHSQGIPPLFLLCLNMFIFHLFMSDKRRQEKTMMNGRWLVQIFQGCLPCQMLIEALKLVCEWELCW